LRRCARSVGRWERKMPGSIGVGWRGQAGGLG
jgi:hypothetical protein